MKILSRGYRHSTTPEWSRGEPILICTECGVAYLCESHNEESDLREQRCKCPECGTRLW